MGHQHLQVIPRTKEWRDVVALISSGAELAAIAGAASKAAEKSMIEASRDAAVRHSFFLLTQIPQAAKQARMAGSFRLLDMEIDNPDPSLVEIGSAMMDSIDRYVSRIGRRTDYGEFAQLSAVESLHAVAGRDALDLFESSTLARSNLAALSNPQKFSKLARDFFSRLMRRHLNFYLHRELSAHVGAGKRFRSIGDHLEFEIALELHCMEASRIIKEFATIWYGKHLAQGGIDRDLAGRFVHVAAKKIRDELQLRGAAHA